MTLILATVTNESILVTADGLSVSARLRQASGRSTLQKVLPIASFPIALAQCGRNFVRVQSPSSQTMSIVDWLSNRVPIDGDVELVAECIRETMLQDDPEFFDDSHDSHFWVCGYSNNASGPRFYRIDHNGLTDLLGNYALPQNFSTGSGVQYLQNGNLESHNHAFDLAIARQGRLDRPVFGGSIHQLCINSDGCQWSDSMEPRRGTLGFRDTFGQWLNSNLNNVPADIPHCNIQSMRESLVNNLCRRALVNGTRHPSTYNGAIEHWAADPTPDWNLTDRLVAGNDDAAIARSDDISQDDERIYFSLVTQVIESLPPVVLPNR